MARLIFTARSGGVSESEFNSLNLATHVGDERSLVEENRKILKSDLSVEKILFMNQVHGNEVEVVTSESPNDLTADALITSEKSLGVAVLVADCLPVLIDGENMVAAVHVGRQGMLNKIIDRTINVMAKNGAGRFKATIGPGICGDCYEVSNEMYSEIIKSHPNSNHGPRHLDIRAEATFQLENLGVEVENLNICTKTNFDFFSYRRDKITGRQCGVICL